MSAQYEEFGCRTGPEACPKANLHYCNILDDFQLLFSTREHWFEITVTFNRFVWKVHDAVKENKLNALEPLHFRTREDC